MDGRNGDSDEENLQELESVLPKNRHLDVCTERTLGVLDILDILGVLDWGFARVLSPFYQCIFDVYSVTYVSVYLDTAFCAGRCSYCFQAEPGGVRPYAESVRPVGRLANLPPPCW